MDIYGGLLINASACEPEFYCDHRDDRWSLRLDGDSDGVTVSFVGTTDEMAALVQRLANVVAERTRRDLDAIEIAKAVAARMQAETHA